MSATWVRLAAAVCRAVFETAAIYLWVRFVTGVDVNFFLVLAAAAVFGLIARSGRASRYLGPLAAVALSLVGTPFGMPLFGTLPVAVYLAWRMQSVAVQPTSTYAIESSFALGLWVFVASVVATDITTIRPGLPHDAGGDGLTLVLTGLVAMVLSRSEDLGRLSRLREAGLEGGLFRRTGLVIVAALAILAFLLALIVSPKIVGVALGAIAKGALAVSYWLILATGYVAAVVAALIGWLERTFLHLTPRPKSGKHPPGHHLAHKIVVSVGAVHTVETVLLIAAGAVGLYLLFRVFSRLVSGERQDGLFTEERLAFRRRPREDLLTGDAALWPYSAAGTRLRQAVGALKGRLKAAGEWPGPSATLREAMAGRSEDAVQRVVRAYEAHRYGGGEDPGADVVRDLDRDEGPAPKGSDSRSDAKSRN